MTYTVTAENIVDTGKGIYTERTWEEHGLTEKEATKLADKLSNDKDSHVFISFFRASDGQTGFLNRDGHSIDGKRW